MRKRAATRLPKQIYVIREKDRNDQTSSYLLADETTTTIEDGATVGVYELKETRRMKITRELR